MIARRQFIATCAAMTGWPVAALANVIAVDGRRVALVIGNDRYQRAPLRSAGNDARAMGELLGKAGFTVSLRIDATRAVMMEAIAAFGRAAAAPGVQLALVYYAGHAAQLDWRNWLMPVDGDVQAAGDVRTQCVDLALVLDAIGRAKVKNAAIVLDACRDDPFGARFRPREKGLSQYDAPSGTLLAFATSPGRVAVDAPGRRHGLYTEHLLRELAVPGVRMEDALKRVRLAVRMSSGGAQVPWESTSLENDLVLFPVPKLSEAELEKRFREELATWDRIKASRRVEDWVDYLRRFPDGKFAEVGHLRLGRLLSATEPIRVATQASATPLVLGGSATVPVSMRESDHAQSAGTFAFRPVWTEGDEYVFEDRDLISGVKTKTVRVVVRRVDLKADRVEFSDGALADLSGNPVRTGGRVFDPPLPFNPAQLQIGRRWSSRFTQTGTARGRGEYTMSILDRPRIKVPAGEFLAFRIEATGWFNPESGGSLGLRVTRWVVPGLNMAVRRERTAFGDARVLVSARQKMRGPVGLV